MIVSRLTPLNVIEIWQPRYKDRKVLVAKYKVKQQNKIVFTKAKHLADKQFYLNGADASKYPIETNGKIACYAIPLDDLEILEVSNE
jgi:hypothetical protein